MRTSNTEGFKQPNPSRNFQRTTEWPHRSTCQEKHKTSWIFVPCDTFFCLAVSPNYKLDGEGGRERKRGLHFQSPSLNRYVDYVMIYQSEVFYNKKL